MIATCSPTVCIQARSMGHLPFTSARRTSPLACGARKLSLVCVDGWRCRMVDLILTTFDWVPETPRGYVRDIRVRWALEEAGLSYRVKSAPFGARNAEHFAHQPFSQ